MANEEHLKILKEGVRAWEQWRYESKETPDLSEVNLSSLDLQDADLSDANLFGSDLHGVDLRGADLRGANLHRANLRGASLSNADLTRADLTDTDLRGADLTRAHFRPISLRKANLSEADLTAAQMSNADLRGAVLNDANLSDAFLHGANLTRANLRGADLRRADLTVADLRGTNLSQTNLNAANIRSANLSYANLDGTNFQDAVAGYTLFGDCDLSKAVGLHLVEHEGPSTLGIDTIYRSRGKIHESFVRGCGIPDGFITQMYSLVEAVDGIQFYSCFISYSSKDDEFARRLHGKMRDAHLRVWFAPEEMKGGDLLIEQIETAIRVYDKLLIVLSKASLQSEWVITELRNARKAERQSKKRKLFPIRLVDFETLRDWKCFDADSGKDLGIELREYFIPDFSNWKDHDQFEAAFSRLLKDLRAEERAK